MRGRPPPLSPVQTGQLAAGQISSIVVFLPVRRVDIVLVFTTCARVASSFRRLCRHFGSFLRCAGSSRAGLLSRWMTPALDYSLFVGLIACFDVCVIFVVSALLRRLVDVI